MIQIIFAHNNYKLDNLYGFGYQNKLPWGHCSVDLKHFKEKTNGTVLIMGANTFKSLPAKLNGRIHIVISDGIRTPTTAANQLPNYTAKNLKRALAMFGDDSVNYSIIGGPRLIMEAVDIADRAFISEIHLDESISDVGIDVDYIKQNFKVIKTEHVQGAGNTNGVIITELSK